MRTACCFGDAARRFGENGMLIFAMQGTVSMRRRVVFTTHRTILTKKA
jgi:hypothetical protein